MLVRTVACIEGSVEIELVCEPAFDYGRSPGEWSLSEDRHRADATGAGQTIRLQTDMLIGIEAHHARARHVLHAGRGALLRALVGRGSAGAGQRRGGQRAARCHDELLAQLARAGADPRPRAAPADPALGARDQGAHVHADRGDRRGADHVAARDTGRGAQLGLPLHVDSGLDVHAPGAALPQPRLGGQRVHAVHRRPRAQRGRRAADHVRDRRSPGSDRDVPRGALGLRRRAPGPDRQRRLRPAPERRVRRGARLGAAAHAPQPAAAAAAVAARPVAGRVRQGGVAQARSGHLGGARQAAALRLLEADVLGRARPRGEARGDPRRRRPRHQLGGDGGRDQGRHPRARSRQARGAAPALRHRRARRLDAAGRASSASCRATTSACARACSRSPTS